MQNSDPIVLLQRYASALIGEAEESSVYSGMPTTDAPSHTPSRRRPFWVRPRMAVATAFFLVGNVGLAAAADSAVPGDLLYPLDLGYEALTGLIGVDTGGAGERIQEAYVLLPTGGRKPRSEQRLRRSPILAPQIVRC